jgi:hypothetical protein
MALAWTLLIVTSCTAMSATNDLGQFDVGSRAGRSIPGTKGSWSIREADFWPVASWLMVLKEIADETLDC